MLIVLFTEVKMNRKVQVKPKSSKAKNRLANIMENNPVCIVEQDTGGELFLVSENRKYAFWTSTRTELIVLVIKQTHTGR
jgi:hypothetical protein